ncbi:unnamed protein product [Blepharisma stoltei]|uniref:Mitochondrial glycoprotein n=1 Tax=Blepharisma stoltei TaxID=1481888 RepID=A0AAU9IXB3_9CILI|nr:unnamed protein product [Blepharisma stoltei]
MIKRLFPSIISPFKRLPHFNFSTFNRLQRSIDKELVHENENYKINEAIPRFLKDRDFTLTDIKDSTQILLTKISHGKNVVVSFNAKIVFKEEKNLPQISDLVEEKGIRKTFSDKEDEKVPFKLSPDFHKTSVDFIVVIKKPDAKSGMVFECSTKINEVIIHKAYSTHDTEISKDISAVDYRYKGRNFENIDSNLRLRMTDYLKDHGIDEELVAFLEAYSPDKERHQYVEFLEKLKNFVK